MRYKEIDSKKYVMVTVELLQTVMIKELSTNEMMP